MFRPPAGTSSTVEVTALGDKTSSVLTRSVDLIISGAMIASICFCKSSSSVAVTVVAGVVAVVIASVIASVVVPVVTGGKSTTSTSSTVSITGEVTLVTSAKLSMIVVAGVTLVSVDKSSGITPRTPIPSAHS